MTEQFVLDLLVTLGVHRVTRDEGTRKFVLHLVRDGRTETCTITDYKRESQEVIADLEEERQSVLENRFTTPIAGKIGLGEDNGNVLRVSYWKKDGQLTPEEELEKNTRLARINKDLQFHRRVIEAMNHVQVHFNEIAHKLVPRGGKFPVGGGVPGKKSLWNKGLKPAALHCLKLAGEAGGEGRTELDICREFVTRYEFSGETQYTAEQLLNAMVQVRLLDRAD